MSTQVPMLAVLIFAGAILLFIGALVKLHFDRKGRLRKLVSVWGAAAKRLDGKFDAGSMDLSQVGSGFELVATVNDIEVRARTRTEYTSSSSGSTSQLVVIVSAKATAPQDVSLKVYRETLFSKLARAVGAQDVEIGDAAFDDTFMIKASDEVFARAWLNSTVRKRLLGASDWSFELKNGRVQARGGLGGVVGDVQAIEPVMRAVAALADGKHAVVRRYKKLAKRLGGKAKKEPTRWASLTAQVDGTPVAVDTMDNGKTHFSVATARTVGAKLTPLVITNDPHEFSPTLPAAEVAELPEGYGAWTAEPKRAAAQLTDDIKSQISKLQPIKVRVDEEQVRVYHVGICPPLTNMHQAVKLAAEIAAGASAGYR